MPSPHTDPAPVDERTFWKTLIGNCHLLEALEKPILFAIYCNIFVIFAAGLCLTTMALFEWITDDYIFMK